jgi:hypothetical protein
LEIGGKTTIPKLLEGQVGFFLSNILYKNLQSFPEMKKN